MQLVPLFLGNFSIVKGTAGTMWRRLMDTADSEITENIERAASGVFGVDGVHDVRVRWLGHRLQAELPITVDEDLPIRESQHITDEALPALFYTQPKLATSIVQVAPCGHGGRIVTTG